MLTRRPAATYEPAVHPNRVSRPQAAEICMRAAPRAPHLLSQAKQACLLPRHPPPHPPTHTNTSVTRHTPHHPAHHRSHFHFPHHYHLHSHRPVHLPTRP